MRSFLARLFAPASPAPLDASEGELALAVLLVRLARSDGTYGADEAERILQLLARRLGLSRDEARALRAQAEEAEVEAPDTVRFTRTLKDVIAYEDRASVIETLWDIAYTDGTRGADEDAIVRLAASLLGVSDRDSALARQRVRLAHGIDQP